MEVELYHTIILKMSLELITSKPRIKWKLQQLKSMKKYETHTHTIYASTIKNKTVCDFLKCKTVEVLI